MTMVTQAKVNGYNDRAALALLQSAHRQMVEDVRVLVDEVDRMTPLRRKQVLARMATALAEQGSALVTMQEIRRTVVG